MYQLISSRTSLEFLLESISPHLLVQGYLTGLNTRCSIRVREDVACTMLATTKAMKEKEGMYG